MSTLLTVFHLVVCVVLILIVMVQSGKDGGIGAMAGGSSQTVFGSSGGANFFTKFTSALAAVFMLTSIGLTITKGGKRSSVFDTNASPVTGSATAPANTSTAPKAPVAEPNAPKAPAEQKK